MCGHAGGVSTVHTCLPSWPGSAMTGTVHNSSVTGARPGPSWAASLREIVSSPRPLNLSPLLRAGAAPPSLGAQWACWQPDSLSLNQAPQV